MCRVCWRKQTLWAIHIRGTPFAPLPSRSPVGPPFCVTTANGSTIFLHTVGLISSSHVKSPNLKPPACVSSPPRPGLKLQISGSCPDNGGPRPFPEPQPKLSTPSTAQTPPVCAPVIAQNVDHDAPDATPVVVIGWAAVDDRSRFLYVSPSAEHFARACVAVSRKSAAGTRDNARMAAADRRPPARCPVLGRTLPSPAAYRTCRKLHARRRFQLGRKSYLGTQRAAAFRLAAGAPRTIRRPSSYALNSLPPPANRLTIYVVCLWKRVSL